MRREACTESFNNSEMTEMESVDNGWSQSCSCTEGPVTPEFKNWMEDSAAKIHIAFGVCTSTIRPSAA